MVFPEAWSLSVEEWFYLMLPLLLVFFHISDQKNGKINSFISLFYSDFRNYHLSTYRYLHIPLKDIVDWDLIFRKQVITRLDSLMFGAIGAYINYYFHATWIKYKRLFLILGVVLFFLSNYIFPSYLWVTRAFSCVLSFSVISLATLFLLPYLSVLKSGKGILYKVITYISITSYSVYLIHLSIVQSWIIYKLPWVAYTGNSQLISLSNCAIYYTLTMTLSILLYQYFEVPMTRIRERIR
jgi:peptidoglycan/LPS O-acetylase OafA/YrhL